MFEIENKCFNNYDDLLHAINCIISLKSKNSRFFDFLERKLK